MEILTYLAEDLSFEFGFIDVSLFVNTNIGHNAVDVSLSIKFAGLTEIFVHELTDARIVGHLVFYDSDLVEKELALPLLKQLNLLLNTLYFLMHPDCLVEDLGDGKVNLRFGDWAYLLAQRLLHVLFLEDFVSKLLLDW